MRQDYGSGRGYGTGLVIVGALVFMSGEAATTEPSLAGATVHAAQLRSASPARLRGAWTAQTGSTVAARTRKPVPAQTKEAD